MADQENGGTATAEPKAFEVPAGFSYTKETTKVGDTEYAIEYLQAESLTDWLNHFKAQGLNAEEVARDYINEIQTQRATQGGKGAVRDAAEEKDENGNVTRSADEVRAAAVAKHQKAARQFILGKPRNRAVGGVTKAKQQEIGAKVMEFVTSGQPLTPDALAEMAKTLGLDPSLFAAAAPQA